MGHKLNVIILAGGQGSRLKGILGKTPKIMAKIMDKPFIEYLVEWLKSKLQEIPIDIYLATGIGHDIINEYVKKNDTNLILIQEYEQLGTLGAAANCVMHTAKENSLYLVLNGDTLFDADLNIAFKVFLKTQESPLVVVKKEHNNQRFGGYIIKDNILIKDLVKTDYISMGAVFTRGIDLVRADKNASMQESIRMMDTHFIQQLCCKAFILDDSTRFIDIGVPESYNIAQLYIPKEF